MIQQVPPFNKLKEGQDEPILDPDIPIIDTHHHLFDRPHLRYMLDDYLADAGLGHRIAATVYMETQAMARPYGPEALRPVGEIEFANGVGATCASRTYGDCLVAAAIVGHADMRLGDGIAETLDASRAAAPGRFRGIRHIAIDDPNPAVMRFLTHRPPPGLLADPKFGLALRQVARRGLTFDTAVLHHQLPDLSRLAAAHGDATIILNHIGLAIPAEPTPDARAETFNAWRENMRDIARHANVYCKIGGLGTSYWGFGLVNREQPIGYQELAAMWGPYVETAIEIFGADRCMAESNFPNDGRTCGFVPLWNALKHIVRNHSAEEKAALFHGTAVKAYAMDLPPAS